MSPFAKLRNFLSAYRKYWLAPVIVLLILLGGLLIMANMSSFAPFLYSII